MTENTTETGPGDTTGNPDNTVPIDVMKMTDAQYREHKRKLLANEFGNGLRRHQEAQLRAAGRRLGIPSAA